MNQQQQPMALKPCPFCGGNPAHRRIPADDPTPNAGGEYVECESCGSATSIVFPVAGTVESEVSGRWNGRKVWEAKAPPPELVERLVGRFHDRLSQLKAEKTALAKEALELVKEVNQLQVTAFERSAMQPMVEILDPGGNVSYRRPLGDPLIAEAERTPGYSVRMAATLLPPPTPDEQLRGGDEDAEHFRQKVIEQASVPTNAEEAAIDERIMAHASEGRMCQRPLACECPGCLERYGPIAPGNVGKDLRSNPTGHFTNPRAG